MSVPAETCGPGASPEVVLVAERGLSDPAWAAPAATVLVRLGARASLSAIERAWETWPSEDLRVATLTALGCFGDADVMGHIDRIPPPEASDSTRRPTRGLGGARGDDEARWRAWELLGARARSAQGRLAEALMAARYVEEDDRVGLDQARVTTVTRSLVAVGVDDPIVADALAAWTAEGFPRTRPAGRWEDALDDTQRERLAAPLREGLAASIRDPVGSPSARLATWQLGRLRDPAAAPLLLDRLPHLSGDERAEAWDALVTVAGRQPLPWDQPPLAERLAPVRDLARRATGSPPDPASLRILVGLAAAGVPVAMPTLLRLDADPAFAEPLVDARLASSARQGTVTPTPEPTCLDSAYERWVRAGGQVADPIAPCEGAPPWPHPAPAPTPRAPSSAPRIAALAAAFALVVLLLVRRIRTRA